MSNSTPLTIIISVTSIIARDQIIKRIYTNLTKEPSTVFVVQQDQVNRIKVFHKVARDIQVLIRTYLVIVIPIIVDLNPLYNLSGSVDFKLDETIKHLKSIITKLESLQGPRILKGDSLEQTFRQLAQSLRGVDA
jgi:hypothetical protein